MRKPIIRVLLTLIFLTAGITGVFAQDHSSLGLDSDIYYLLEQCSLRGLCRELPPVKPWTRTTVLSLINEALQAGAGKRSAALNAVERKILENYRTGLLNEQTGLDFLKGRYYNKAEIGRSGFEVSGRVGVGLDIEGSASVNTDAHGDYGLETWVGISLDGDIGSHVSYQFSLFAAALRAPREWLGTYDSYYPTYADPGPGQEYENHILNTYSQPLTHFPYTYKKRWDGSVHYMADLSGYESWPDSLGFGYGENFEISSGFFDDRIFFRIGRLEHDWGITPMGSSLAFNQSARPFIAMEGTFRPFSWFSLSSLTGILEYYNEIGIKKSAASSQKAFSISMLGFSFKNYFFLDLGHAVVWPKRWELGYFFPFANMDYQNNIGDFDNTAYFLNFKAQYPGLGNIWLSAFGDEAYLKPDMFILDRTMIAYQGGAEFYLPTLPFASIKLSYTKIEPYTYTHTIINVPWYRTPVEQAYTNNGVGLGHYLPPNADELLLRFEVRPALRTSTHFQYQMIRHGADYGPSAVDGSSLQSELDTSDRNTNPVLRKYFLHDGAYQWLHVLKAGVGHTFAIRDATPFHVFCEAGVVFSYFTNINGAANSGVKEPYHIDSVTYPRATSFILTLGLKVFPKL
jgi:hypothetical protein